MHPYDFLINKITSEARTQKCRVSEENDYKKYITIDSFFDVIYSLFKSNNLLVEDQQELSENTYNKFVFTEDYPNSTNAHGNIVTFELTRRAPASLGAGQEPFSGTKHFLPMYIGEEVDMENNDKLLYYSHMYDNEITLTCWSPYSKGARLTASLIENIMNTAYYFIRLKVPVFIMIGRQEPIFTTKYENKKLVGIPITFFVRTNEVRIVKKETLEHMPELLLDGFKLDAHISTTSA